MIDAAKGWVPVRITDMAGVDLSMFRFDFDLTFAVLLMNADGTIYHTFAGRDWTHADSHLDRPAQPVISLSHVMVGPLPFVQYRHPEGAPLGFVP